jgi:hypothetical protein
MTSKEFVDKSRVARWLLAVVLLGVGVIGGVLHWFETCEGKALNSGQVVTLCRDPSVSDAIVVFAGLVLVLLISPDFEEAGLFGFALKRRVQEQAAHQQELAGQLAAVAARVEAVAAATATANTNVYVLTEAMTEQAKREVRVKEAEYYRGLRIASGEVSGREEPLAEAEGRVPVPTPATPPENADLRAQVISIWEKLDELLWISPRVHPAGSIGVRDRDAAVGRQRFIDLFADELQVVRAARNLAAHGQPVDTRVLEDAVEVGNELLRIAREGLASAPGS